MFWSSNAVVAGDHWVLSYICELKAVHDFNNINRKTRKSCKTHGCMKAFLLLSLPFNVMFDYKKKCIAEFCIDVFLEHHFISSHRKLCLHQPYTFLISDNSFEFASQPSPVAPLSPESPWIKIRCHNILIIYRRIVILVARGRRTEDPEKRSVVRA